MKKRRLPWQFIATALLAGALVIAIAKGQVVAAILVGVLLVSEGAKRHDIADPLRRIAGLTNARTPTLSGL